MSCGLYIHIPYCKRKCRYCDFYSLSGRRGVPDRYVDRVLEEISSYGDLCFDTVYFGGGTPSLLEPVQVERILTAVQTAPGAEVTLEANPDSLDPDKLAGYRKAGVNRLSIGVQSADDRQLEVLGRLHDRKQAEEAFRMARRAGFENMNGDVMLGLSDYTSEEMKRTIDLLVDGGATHISAYMLKIEEGTPFWTDPPEHLSTEEELTAFYLEACRYLEEKGFCQYEISNFARKGFESRHNLIYWHLEDYLGIGPAAYSCMNGRRFHYPRDLDAFMDGNGPIEDGTVDADEFIMLSLRLTEGLDLAALKDRWGLVLPSRLMRRLAEYEKGGLLTVSDGRVRLTARGFLVENYISSDIMRNAVSAKDTEREEKA